MKRARRQLVPLRLRSMDTRPIVLSLCDRTGNMVRPWAEDGRFRCIALDLQHQGVKLSDGIEFVGGDVTAYLPPLGAYAICFAFPPCTHLAVSGARWFGDKGLSALHQAIGIVEACRRIAEWTEAPWIVENPVSTLSTYWRKPNFIFDPCDFGGYGSGDDAYTKKTCLWTGGGFVMPTMRRIEPVLGSKMHTVPPSPDRADARSETPKGFAKAVYLANQHGEGVS